jgi:hypothetical protein
LEIVFFERNCAGQHRTMISGGTEKGMKSTIN